MIILIAQIISIGSLFGMAVILFRKIPDLLALAPSEAEKIPLMTRLKIRVQKINPFKIFSPEKILEKFLLRLRILTLKAENKTNHWIKKLKEKSREKEKIEESDNYWDELKKAKEER